MRVLKLFISATIFFVIISGCFAVQGFASEKSIMFIIDFSNSMNQMLGNKSKIDIAREVVANTIDKIEAGAKIGLTFYGHREKDKCDDIEIVMPLQKAEKQTFSQKMSDYKPAGNASTDLALKKAAEILNNNEDYVNFVLITDASNKCEKDLYKSAREVRQKYDYRFNFYTVLISPDKKEFPKYNFAVKSLSGQLYAINSVIDIKNTIESLVSSINSYKPYYPKTVTNNDMVLIPAGEFYMGTDDRTFDPIERPKHKVYLDAFYIDKYEVTQKQYYEVMGENPSFWLGSDLPVDSVSWKEAKTFCEKIGKRLPTEAEWEKAAKGGTNDKWAGTSDMNKLEEYIWIHDTGANMKTHPVGLRKPNAYGVYDMSGNVWEWVSDWYGESYYSKSPEKNPQGPEKGFMKILRGGNWDSHIYEVRTTSRYPKNPDAKYCNNGFRCAKSVEPNENR
ncbi:MAG: SUMF1/EgtB/PvdO family nonheme iron enzyme [Nitrospirae bacterium]|nr:SUMF1/EgtB/PvdO family nonheme iron enzyme [Nitrospirota bacterium]